MKSPLTLPPETLESLDLDDLGSRFVLAYIQRDRVRSLWWGEFRTALEDGVEPRSGRVEGGRAFAFYDEKKTEGPVLIATRVDPSGYRSRLETIRGAPSA